MAHCSESILEAITGGTNSSPQLQPGQSGKRLCQRTTTSSSSMTCCHLMSEPLALTPVAHSATRVKASSSRVSGHKDVRMLVLLIYAKIQHIMECMLLFQVWLRSAGCRLDGAAGCTLHHCCAAEEVHTRSHTPSYQVKKPFLSVFSTTYLLLFYFFLFFERHLAQILFSRFSFLDLYLLQQNTSPAGINNLSSYLHLYSHCLSRVYIFFAACNKEVWLLTEM